MGKAILGISAHYHDAAAALVIDGRVVAASSEERFSRIKHDAALPVRAVQFCLRRAGLSMGDVERVVYYEKPLRKFERILVTQLATFPKSRASFVRGMRNWLTERLWLSSSIPKALGCAPERLIWSDHHLSHAASAFYGSPHSEAAILVVDGVGEWASTTLYRGDSAGIRKLAEIRFPHSLGLLYSAFTAWLGFSVNDGEYKVMGMAAFGQPRYEEEVRKILKKTPDGGFEVDLDYVSWHWSATDSTTERFHALFGPPCAPGAPFDPATPEGRKAADVAASIQKVCEDTLVDLTRHLYSLCPSENLCFAGGVALNSVANRQILLRGPYRNLWVHPAAGDAGGAAGAALWAAHEVVGGAARAPVDRPDLGDELEPGATQRLLQDLGLPFTEVSDVAARAGEDIGAGRVIGWVQGRAEWGPRALGHRSILADPVRQEMLDRVNRQIKYREPFRPFAPSVRAGAEARYFDVPPGADQPVRWMLLVAPVKSGSDRDSPGDPARWATTHVDGSARLHVVEEQTNPLYHQLLGEVERHTGHPVALNTSFNLKGEPMVNSAMDAIATFRRCGLEALYLGPFRVTQGAA